MQNGWSLSRSREMRLPGCAGKMVLVFITSIYITIDIGISFVLLLVLVLVIVLLSVFRCESISGTYPGGWLIGPKLF